MSATAHKEYLDIQRAWKNDVSSSDIYHMILDWLLRWEELIEDKKAIEDIKRRMDDNDSTNDIVADFIYGKSYEGVRSQFTR